MTNQESSRRRTSRPSLGTALATILVAAMISLPSTPPLAKADSAPANPTDPTTPPTVSIDALPTVQHNGVAWNQLVLGNTVYVVGSFTRARPAGSATGQNEIVRNNVLAYDLATGVLKSSFNPDLNGQAYAVAAAPDGSRIYLGGEFTTVGGVARSRLAAVDPTSGALVSGFAARTDGTVRALAATAGTVFVGGSFSAVNGTARPRLAAVRASDGLLLAGFAPTMTGNPDSNPRVNALQLSPAWDRLVVGGNFVTLNGANRPGYGLGMLDATTGASLPLAANDVVRNGGKDSAILSLSSDGTRFYGTGYIYGTGGNLEGAFSATWSDGRIAWVEDCHGDSYGVYPSATAVYVAGHPHYCLNLGGYPETSPAQRAVAFSKAATGVLTPDTRGYPSFTGQSAPTLLNFFPQLTTGTATGQNQAAWSVVGAGKYVAYAGEFKQVNGSGQQGMVRFGTSEVAPNKQGPKASGTAFTPTLTSPGAGAVRVSWTANYDYDNSDLTYTVLRDDAPVATVTRASTWWSRPEISLNDSGMAPGSHSYRVRVADPFGNLQLSPAVSISVSGTGNSAPVARFTSTANRRSLSVDGTSSTDADGSIAAYEWSWGDGQTGTGAAAGHTYAADGSYTVELTVTDDGGARHTTTQTVQISDSATALASDAFGRTVGAGFGSADVGGAWVTNGSGFSVNGSQGLVRIATAGQGPWAQLGGVSSTAVDLTAGIVLDARPNAGAAYVGTIGRRVGSADYRTKIKIDAGGAVTLSAVRVAGSEAALQSLVVPGLTYQNGARLNTRLQVSGTSPTTVRAKVWLSSSAEPSAWQVSATDSTPALQSAGSVGLHTYLSTSAANGPWTFRFDDFVARPL